MESEKVGRKDMGGSLPVENVQALASNNLKDIPHRYIRPEVESEVVSDDESIHIPVIDMSKLIGNQSSSECELAQLHLACKEWGFFQLINHEVSEEVIERMKNDTKEFFKLPLEEKKTYAQLPNSIEGYGQAFVVSEEQKLDWGDMYFLLPQPVSQRNLRFWPNYPTSFSATLEKYSTEVQKLSICILRLMAKNLGVDSQKLADMFEEGHQGLRMNYYPPCVHANKVIGLNKHSDATGLTLLIQVNEVQGLQIKNNGKWVPIRPIPGAFIVNVGDVIEIMSNKEYKSIEHRAIVNPEKERLSIAAFHSPNMEVLIGPLPDLVRKNDPIYKTINNEEYMRLNISNKLDAWFFAFGSWLDESHPLMEEPRAKWLKSKPISSLLITLALLFIVNGLWLMACTFNKFKIKKKKYIKSKRNKRLGFEISLNERFVVEHNILPVPHNM